MGLRLSAHERRLFEASLRTLLAPFDFADADAWRSAVNDRVKTLLGADLAMFYLPNGKSGLSYYSDEIDRDVLTAYPSYWDRLHRPCGTLQRQIQLGVCDRQTLWRGHLAAYYRSAYYNDYIKPIRAFNALMVTVAPFEHTDFERSAGIFFYHDHPNRTPFGTRGHGLLRMLMPALKAGVEYYTRFHDQRATFLAAIDVLQEGILLCSVTTGRVLHRNCALNSLLEADPERVRLLKAMKDVAGALSTSHTKPDREGPPGGGAVHRVIQTAHARYRLRGNYLSEPEASILVSLEPCRSLLPAERRLREWFGLTKQQARVARLLAARKTTAEIAEALFISPHTVRRHVEQVLFKLNVASRHDVRAAVLEKMRSAPM